MAVLLTVLALWQKNFFFAVFVVIAEISIIVLARRRPRVIEFTIDETGIRAGEDIALGFAEMEGFAIVERPGRLNEIVLKRPRSINPYFRLPIDSVLAKEAKKILSEKLTEMEYEESFLDLMADRLGF